MKPNQPWTIQDIPDQSGRVVIVTGATSGTGLETAKALAGAGATVVLACRNGGKTQEVIRAIQAVQPGAKLVAQPLELDSLRSVRAAAAAIRERFERIDLLINNAGVMIPPRGRTEDGFETQLGTNHFGPFAFTGLLLDRLSATPGARIVTMSSIAHRNGRIHFDDLNFERGYKAWPAYSQSKLANLLFTYELQRRLGASGSATLAVAAHPGWARTELQRHTGGMLGLLMAGIGPWLSQDQQAGALPLLRAATDPAVRAGEYYGPDGFQEMKGEPVRVQSVPRSHDRELQQRLWQCSEQTTGVVYGI
jgi:NAD(P)-dependent dehydrogenase (short-subunit alcohol dehydrogenase family)